MVFMPIFRVIVICVLAVPYIVSEPMKNEIPFSYKELLEIPSFDIKKPSFVRARDGVDIAYYSFLPKSPSAIVVFYHGGGMYSNKAYQNIGMQLEQHYAIGSYFVDIRGHGHSQGPRGDASSIEQVLDDISTMLDFVKKEHPMTPVYLAGHSSGAGLILNYSVYPKKKSALYDGYILLAPYLGPRVGVERTHAPAFAKKVRLWIYLLNHLFKIPVFQHIPAVFFNYPQEILDVDPLIVTTYSYTMSCATTPHNPQSIFEKLDKPTFVYVGADDEQFDPEKVCSFVNYNKTGCISHEIVPDSKHLSILLKAPELIARTINPTSFFLKRGKDYLDNHYDYKNAIQCFLHVILLCDHQLHSLQKDSVQAQAWAGVAISYHHTGNHEQRDTYLEKLHKFLEISGNDSPLLSELACAYYVISGYKAYVEFEQCKKLGKSRDDQEAALLAAQEFFLKVMEQARTYPITSEWVSHAYQGLGTVYEFLCACFLECNNHEKAHEYAVQSFKSFESALIQRKKLLGDDHLHVARSLHKLARAHARYVTRGISQEKNDADYTMHYEKANLYYHEAIDIYMKHAIDPTHPKFKELLDEYDRFKKTLT